MADITQNQGDRQSGMGQNQGRSASGNQNMGNQGGRGDDSRSRMGNDGLGEDEERLGDNSGASGISGTDTDNMNVSQEEDLDLEEDMDLEDDMDEDEDEDEAGISTGRGGTV